MDKEKPSYYAIIPADIRYHPDLCANAKLLYGEITCLCNKKGYCWAKNKYFAELYGVDKSTVSRWVAKLIAIGRITSEIVYMDDKKTVSDRIIRLTEVTLAIPIGENVNTPIGKKVKGGIGKKVKVNSTSVNTTSKNTIPTGKEKIQPLPTDMVKQYFLPAHNSYPGVTGEYWQDYHCFMKGCKTSGLDLSEEIKLIIPAIEAQVEYRKGAEGFVPEWKGFSGWLTTCGWHWRSPTKPKEADPYAMPRDKCQTMLEEFGIIEKPAD